MVELPPDALDALLEMGDTVIDCAKLCIYRVKACAKIAAQVINPLVHRLLIEPTRAKDAYDECRQGKDDGDNQRIHCF